MPIWLRKFTFFEIQKHYDNEKKEYEKASKGKGETNLLNPDGTVNTPAFMQASKPYQKKSTYK